MKELFPIGSVVTPKNSEKLMMIIGLLQKDNNNNYDYISVPYPEGFINSDTFFLFNHEDIESIEFVGFVNADMQLYAHKILEKFNSQAE